MGTRAKGGTHLAALVRMAMPLCKQAEREHPRTGRGRRPDHPDWLLAVIVMVTVLKKKKSKSAQFRFLSEHQRELKTILGVGALPARSTYFDRYRRAHELFTHAIRLQGEKAVGEGIADPRSVAVDKSLIASRGPLWHKSDRQKSRIPKRLQGVDRDSAWGCSMHDGWVQGYSFEVVVSATKKSIVFPLLASVDTASAKETTTFEPKSITCRRKPSMCWPTVATIATTWQKKWNGKTNAIARIGVFSALKTEETRSRRT